MARPVARRRSERDAPDADKYAGRSSRGRDEDDGGDEDRRPRRGRERGELPGRSRRESKPESPVDLPTTLREVKALDDDDFNALCDFFELDKDAGEDDLWEAVEKHDGGDDQGDEDEPPRRGRGRSRDDEDEPPARGRGRGRNDGEDDEDKPRGRGRGRSRDEDDDDKPRGRRGSRSRDDGDDDRPRRQPRAGFEGYKTTKSKTYTGDFKLTPDLLLAKFLDDEPFDSYAEHSLFQELGSGQRVWICIEDDCPICNTGHKPKAVALWNIIAIPEDGEPKLEVLKAGPMLSKEIEKKSSLKTGPMSKEYYALAQPEQKKGEGVIGPIVELVRERDVKPEWGFDPFTDKELDEFAEDVPDPKGYVQFPPLRDLKDVAKQLRDRD